MMHFVQFLPSSGRICTTVCDDPKSLFHLLQCLEDDGDILAYRVTDGVHRITNLKTAFGWGMGSKMLKEGVDWPNSKEVANKKASEAIVGQVMTAFRKIVDQTSLTKERREELGQMFYYEMISLTDKALKKI